MLPNQRLILIQKWYDTRDVQLIFCIRQAVWRFEECHRYLQLYLVNGRISPSSAQNDCYSCPEGMFPEPIDQKSAIS